MQASSKAHRHNSNSNDKFWLLFDQAAVGMALALPDGHFIRANPQLCLLLGYPESALRETRFQAITHPDDLGAELLLVNKALEGQIRTYNIEKRYVRRGGDVIWAAVSATLVPAEGEQPAHFLMVIQDITERKAAQEELARVRERCLALSDHIGDFVSIHDLEGTYLYASAQA